MAERENKFHIGHLSEISGEILNLIAQILLFFDFNHL